MCECIIFVQLYFCYVNSFVVVAVYSSCIVYSVKCITINKYYQFEWFECLSQCDINYEEEFRAFSMLFARVQLIGGWIMLSEMKIIKEEKNRRIKNNRIL